MLSRKNIVEISMFVITLLLSVSVQAETIYVNLPFDNIGDAIDGASNGDLILVGPGTYKGVGNVNLSFQGKSIEVRSVMGAAATIIDCEGTSRTRAFEFVNSETSTSKLIGFTIKNGNASSVPVNGGGALLIGASPTIKDCVFENCQAQVGGAIQVFNSVSFIYPLIEDCIFRDNSAISTAGVGGGINIAKNARPTIRRCYFDGNFSDYHGGAISVGSAGGASGTIDQCVFVNNYTDGYGTVYITGDATVRRSTFAKNDALIGGTALAILGEVTVSLVRSIVAFNDATGVVCGNGAILADTCNVFYENSGGSIVGDCDSTDVDPNTIFENPLFCDLDNDVYTISSYSPSHADSSKCGLLIGRYGEDCSYCCTNRGDVDNLTGPGGPIDVSDLTYLIAFLFDGGPPPPCIEAGNVDNVIGPAGPIDVSDLTFLVAFLFQDGPQPPQC